MKGAFGIPLGFRSSDTTAFDITAVLSWELVEGGEEDRLRNSILHGGTGHPLATLSLFQPAPPVIILSGVVLLCQNQI